ncbi:MAG TPA: hypothetical protein VGF52_01485 [Tepidisphaeraceae bacterium]
MADLLSEDPHIMPRGDFDWRGKKEISYCLFPIANLKKKNRDLFFSIGNW